MQILSEALLSDVIMEAHGHHGTLIELQKCIAERSDYVKGRKQESEDKSAERAAEKERQKELESARMRADAARRRIAGRRASTFSVLRN